MKTPHKHAALIKAWAAGAEIEYRPQGSSRWTAAADGPGWYLDTDYRIKPEPRPDLVYYCSTRLCAGGNYTELVGTKNRMPTIDMLKLTFDGETLELKSAEVLK